MWNIFIKKNAIIGSKINWHTNPTKKSLGCLDTLLKSVGAKPRPRPNINMANAIGAIVVTISICC